MDKRLLQSVSISAAITLPFLGWMAVSVSDMDNPPPAFFYFFMVLATTLPIAALVDAARVPRDNWQAAGLDKTTWIVLILVGGFVGAIAFFGWIRKRVAHA